MERTEYLGLSQPTFDDKPDMRLIADDHQKLDIEAKRLEGAKANKSEVVANDDYRVLRLDGGNMLKGGEDVFELPVGVYWSYNYEVTQSIKNKPDGVTNRSVIRIMSANGHNDGWKTIVWQSVLEPNTAAFVASNHVKDNGEATWYGWTQISTLSQVGATNWDSGNLPVKTGQWTPRLETVNGGGSPELDYRGGYYMLQGRALDLHFTLAYKNLNGLTGDIVITGSPFVSIERGTGNIASWNSPTFSQGQSLQGLVWAKGKGIQIMKSINGTFSAPLSVDDLASKGLLYIYEAHIRCVLS